MRDGRADLVMLPRMEQLIHAMTKLVSASGEDNPNGPRPMKVDTSSAPPCVRELAEALAKYKYRRIDLGNYDIATTSGPLRTLEVAFEMAEEAEMEDIEGYLETAGPDGTPFDPTRTLHLADDGGGMSSLGIYWWDDSACLVLVEMDDPTEDNLVELLRTPEKAFKLFEKLNPTRQVPPGVVALREAMA